MPVFTEAINRSAPILGQPPSVNRCITALKKRSILRFFLLTAQDHNASMDKPVAFSHGQIKDFLAFANSLADLARSITMRFFRQHLNIENKPDASPVTIADKNTELALQQAILKRYPEHGVSGEEHGEINAHKSLVWVIDPIDGTKSFVSGIPLFGTLIGLMHKGRPLLGVADIPALNERWSGSATFGSQLNKKSCQSANTTLEDARIYCTSLDMLDNRQQQQFSTLSQQCRFRGFGGDCYNYTRLASGSIDIVMEADLKPCDILPLVPIIEGAGGIITDLAGQPLTMTNYRTALAAANLTLHQQALRAIQQT